MQPCFMKVQNAPRALTPFCVICASTAIGCKCLPFFVFAAPLQQFREAQLSLGRSWSNTYDTACLCSVFSHNCSISKLGAVLPFCFSSVSHLLHLSSSQSQKYLSFHMCIFPAFSNLAFVSAAKSVVYKPEQNLRGIKGTYKNISCIVPLIWNKWNLQHRKWMWWCKWDHKSMWPGKLLSAMIPSCPWNSSHSL